MKIEKNKIVFATVIVVIIAFLVSYYLLVVNENQEENNLLQETIVPNLDENQKTYNSKLEAINDLKEVRETNAPSIYDEHLIDTSGYYDPEFPDKQKEHIIDSIYNLGQSRYAMFNNAIPNADAGDQKPLVVEENILEELQAEKKIEAKEIGLEHQLFFASAPQEIRYQNTGAKDQEIPVVVDGTQVVEAHSRIRMRLTRAAIIGDIKVPKNTLVFGFISFQPNRVLINIENIDKQSTNLKAFDLQDGSEGIYIKNNFRSEATTEVLDDLIGDINIPSIPQVSGITKILKRHNRKVKVTVLNNYRLILKPTL